MTIREEILKNSGLLTEWNPYSGYSDDNSYLVVFKQKAANKYYECDDSNGIADTDIRAKNKAEAEYFLRNYWKDVKERIISEWRDMWKDDDEEDMIHYLDDLKLSDVKLR